MRFFASLGASVLCLLSMALAQEPPLPQPETQDPASEKNPTPNALASPAPQLIPPDVLAPNERGAAPVSPAPNFPGVQQLDESFKQNPLSAATENARKHSEWRNLQNQVANDGDLKTALRTAERARTDLRKRQLLRVYYELYFAKMTALASTPEMKAYLTERKSEKLAALPQPRVRPTPTPTPAKSPR